VGVGKAENMKLKMTTSITENAIVSHEVAIENEHEEVVMYLLRLIVDTREHQIRDALIAIGWQPPREV
jgi:hypothetical protein